MFSLFRLLTNHPEKKLFEKLHTPEAPSERGLRRRRWRRVRVQWKKLNFQVTRAPSVTLSRATSLPEGGMVSTPTQLTVRIDAFTYT